MDLRGNLLERRRDRRLGAVRRLARRSLRPARRHDRRRPRGSRCLAGHGLDDGVRRRPRRPDGRLVRRAGPLRACIGLRAAEPGVGGGHPARERAGRVHQFGRLPGRPAPRRRRDRGGRIGADRVRRRRRDVPRVGAPRRDDPSAVRPRFDRDPSGCSGRDTRDRPRAGAADARARRRHLAGRDRDRRRRVAPALASPRGRGGGLRRDDRAPRRRRHSRRCTGRPGCPPGFDRDARRCVRGLCGGPRAGRCCPTARNRARGSGRRGHRPRTGRRRDGDPATGPRCRRGAEPRLRSRRRGRARGVLGLGVHGRPAPPLRRRARGFAVAAAFALVAALVAARAATRIATPRAP